MTCREMKLSLYFPDSFPDKELAGRTIETDPEAYPSGQIFMMGRHSECHFHIKHKQVSLRHCAFRYTPPSSPNDAPQWELADWGSSNGTYLKHRRLDPKNWEPLETHDRFYLIGPDLTIVVIEADDTLQAEEATIVQPFELTKAEPQRPYTWGDALYEVAKWVTTARTPAGGAYRFLLAALATAIVTVLFALIID